MVLNGLPSGRLFFVQRFITRRASDWAVLMKEGWNGMQLSRKSRTRSNRPRGA